MEQDRLPVSEESSVFERLLDASEAAALLKINAITLKRMAARGEVPAFKIGDLWRFRASALDKWLEGKVCSTNRSRRLN